MDEEPSDNGPSIPAFQITFKEVVVVLNDGNETLMNKCLNCGFVTRSNSFSKIAHWRSCPSKMLFKYVKQRGSMANKRGYLAMCMACRATVCGTSNFQMSEHYNKKCARLSQNPDDVFNNIESNDVATEFEGIETPDGIEYFREDVISRREIDGQKKLQNIHDLGDIAQGFLYKYSIGPKGMQRHAECQQCFKKVGRPFGVKFATHRRGCPLNTGMILNGSMQPMSTQNNLSLFDTTISSSMIDDGGATTSGIANGMRMCFICNTTSSESFVSLYETLSAHSQTPLFDFVWKFLDDQPTVRDDSIDGANSNWSVVCDRCRNKINQYDYACITAARLEQELRDELAQTEAFYSGKERIDEQNEYINESNDQQPQPQQQEQQQQQRFDEPNQSNPSEVVVYEEDPLDVAINLDSPPPVQIEQQQSAEANDGTRCIIELSDEEEEVQAIELSDDE